MFAERIGVLKKIAEIICKRRNDLASTISREMGKPIRESIEEVERSIQLIQHYAVKAPSLLAEELVEMDDADAQVRLEPLGIIFVIMPWNYPLLLVIRSVIPVLLAGNTVILKHAGQCKWLCYGHREDL